MHPEDEHGHRRTLLRLRPLKSRAARAQRFRRGVYLLPSAFTMANMFCGYACIVYAMHGELATAAPFIGFAFVLDMLDGRVARMTGTTSAFGVEFDSLADVISFGVAPAILSFQWGLGRSVGSGGRPAFSSWRLRRAAGSLQHPVRTQDKRYFVGLPSPAAAAVPAATVFAYPAGFQGRFAALARAGMVLVPALLMVSTIRFAASRRSICSRGAAIRVLFLLGARARAARVRSPDHARWSWRTSIWPQRSSVSPASRHGRQDASHPSQGHQAAGGSAIYAGVRLSR